MKTYYHYVRDKINRPVVTHCFVIDGGTYARGTAVCSDKDNPCKAEGRKKAFSRAMMAFYRQEDRVSCGHYTVEFKKQAFMPEPLPIERKFLEKRA